MIRKTTVRTRSTRRSRVDVIKLSDGDLLRLRDESVAELTRRCPERPIDFGDIKSQEAAKRALTVAIAGKHSILLLGAPGCGKSLLRSAARHFGLCDTFEARSCPCGYWNDPRHACHCTVAQIQRHLAKLPEADITIEVPPVPMREWESTTWATGNQQIQQTLEAMRKPVPSGLDQYARELWGTSAREYGLSADRLDRTQRIAATIAALDNCDVIATSHIMEAINYYPLRRG
ncbi:MAG: ATP-binding protein [Planctomycetaceae bacterium]|nr:MAG: ATP-binding protein [Planctomycetaceae bacterium]